MARNRVIVPVDPLHFTHSYDYVDAVLTRRKDRRPLQSDVVRICVDAFVEWLDAHGRFNDQIDGISEQ